MDYSKIYTHAPEKHPNFILGSLQLLFWLFFRPQAWQNHINNIVDNLDYESTDRQAVKLRNNELWKLSLQVNFVTPIFTAFMLLSALGLPLDRVAYGLAVGLPISLVFGPVISLVVDLLTFLHDGRIHVENKQLVMILVVSLATGAQSTGLAVGLAISVAFGLKGIIFGILIGVGGGVRGSMAYGIAYKALVNLAGGVVEGLAEIMVEILAYFVALGIDLWQPILTYPFLTLFHILLYNLDKKFIGRELSFLRWHSAFWDEYQFIPFIGLGRHLVRVTEQNPDEGKAAIEYLNNSLQRWTVKVAERAVQAAEIEQQIELDAQHLERSNEVRSIRDVHHNLVIGEQEGKASPILRIFSRISEDVDGALNQRSNYNQRQALIATADRLNANLQDLTRSSNKYAHRFRPIAKSWYEIITNHIEKLAKEVELRQEINDPYILAIPLTQREEIFGGRDDTGNRIEQLILDRRRPPLLLYGQRRMGKTSLLYNLGKLLPNTIIPMFVDLQGAPSSANNYTGFLYNLARGMITSAKKEAVTLPPLTRETLKDDPFTCFDEWLDRVEEVLEQNTALLMLDEFEVLDSAITKGRFDEQDVLGMLRHLIQHRPRFKVMLAGSHTIEEYQRWASYLINVQVVHISYLEEKSARKLIEHPIEDFMLRYDTDAVERVLKFTRCHPFLVQLLCSEIVAYKNEQDPSVRRLATLDDVEAAVTEALNSGSFFFADIQNNQVNAVGLDILRFMAARGEGEIVNKNTILQEVSGASESDFQKLLQRELIEKVKNEEEGDGYRFQVELIRRWFAR